MELLKIVNAKKSIVVFVVVVIHTKTFGKETIVNATVTRPFFLGGRSEELL
jgi:hypothetical protein